MKKRAKDMSLAEFVEYCGYRNTKPMDNTKAIELLTNIRIAERKKHKQWKQLKSENKKDTVLYESYYFSQLGSWDYIQALSLAIKQLKNIQLDEARKTNIVA